MRLPLPLPRWIAHRGGGSLAPENTLAGIRLAARLGYRAVEFDVMLSADGTPFLIHDATLERTTNGHGTGGDLPWAQLAQLDAAGGRSLRGPTLPARTPCDATISQCFRHCETKCQFRHMVPCRRRTFVGVNNS